LYRDNEDQNSESDHDSDSEDENEGFDNTATEAKETAEVSSLRTTRSGVQFAPVDESILERKEGNKKVDREMQRLSGFFNHEANSVITN